MQSVSLYPIDLVGSKGLIITLVIDRPCTIRSPPQTYLRVSSSMHYRAIRVHTCYRHNSFWTTFFLTACYYHKLQLGARDGIIVSLFTLFPVDDIPDLIEVLIT